MRTHSLATSACIAAILLAAGQAASMEPDTQRRQTQRQPGEATQTERNRPMAGRADALPTFRSASELLDRDVANPNGEVVGEAEDFIVDRGSGRIEYMLVESGSVMGVGGRTIAVPYTRFGHDEAQERFTLDMTPEQVRQAAEFVPENWTELKQTSWIDDLDRMILGDNPDEDRNADPYEVAVRAATKESVKGTITSVRRETRFGDEEVVVTVRTDDGKSREVILGPSWYVMSHNAAPMRGDAIDANVRVVETDGGGMTRLYATSIEVDDHGMTLRDDEGRPSWYLGKDQRANNTDNGKARPGRLMLLSDLVGAKARALDTEGGEIQDALIETRSGNVAILCFDPNENVLGIADTIRCIPWQVATVGTDGVVRFDADKAMLVSAVEMPDDVKQYDGGSASLAGVYRVFQVEQPDFKPRSAGDRDMPRGKDGQSAYRWMKSRDGGKPVNYTGKIVDHRSAPLSSGEAPTHTVSISTPEGTQIVVLGPTWYMDRQSLKLKSNDQITIQGRRVEIDGRTYIIADSIQTGDNTIELWKNDQPAWARR